MEIKCFEALFNFFITPVEITQDGAGNLFVIGIPVKEFYHHSKWTVYHFRGEVTRNLSNKEIDADFMNNELIAYIDKITCQFEEEFKVDFNNPHKKFEECLANFPVIEFQDPFEYALKIKWNAYHFAIKLLRKRTNGKTTNIIPVSDLSVAMSNERVREQQKYFKLNIREYRWVDLFALLTTPELIDKSTSMADFIDAFSGRRVRHKLTWTGDTHSLSIFIKQLNHRKLLTKEIKPFIWEIVADIFKPELKDRYTIDSLSHSHKTKGKDYSDIIYLVDEIEGMVLK